VSRREVLDEHAETAERGHVVGQEHGELVGERVESRMMEIFGVDDEAVDERHREHDRAHEEGQRPLGHNARVLEKVLAHETLELTAVRLGRVPRSTRSVGRRLHGRRRGNCVNGPSPSTLAPVFPSSGRNNGAHLAAHTGFKVVASK